MYKKKDTGIYDAMNQGIEVAQGDYMIFMNAGDKFYDSEVLKRIADGIEETSGDLYYGRCYNQILDVVDPAPKKLTKYFCYRSMICHQATIYKTSMLKKRGYECFIHGKCRQRTNVICCYKRKKPDVFTFRLLLLLSKAEDFVQRTKQRNCWQTRKNN